MENRLKAQQKELAEAKKTIREGLDISEDVLNNQQSTETATTATTATTEETPTTATTEETPTTATIENTEEGSVK